MQNLEKQIAILECQIKNNKTKNPYAVKNKINNLKAQLVATTRAAYWNQWLSR
jgi:hypothetical protein